MHPVLGLAGSSPVFEATTAPYLLLDTDLRICAVNGSYARATGRTAEELLGQFMFDAFPDNPDAPDAHAVANLEMSVERVLRTGAPHDMGVQRYDIPTQDAPGGFLTKTWAPVNSPLTADGTVVGVLHHVEDLTEAHRIFRAASPALRDHLTPPLRHALRVVSGSVTGQAIGPDPHRLSAIPAQRDRMWHELVHAARRSPAKSCADAMCDVAAEVFPHIEGVAITLFHLAQPSLEIAATNPWTQRVEELQLVTGEGPSPAAFTTGVPTFATGLSLADARWPAYAESAHNLGVTAASSYPLRTASSTIGTITFYCRTTGQRLPPQAPASALSDVAATVLITDVSPDVIARFSESTGFAEINFAAGFLSQRDGIAIPDAAARLRAAAYSSDRRLIDVARDLIASSEPEGDGVGYLP